MWERLPGKRGFVMTFHAYFKTADNTIVEAALRREDITLDAFQDRQAEAADIREAYGWDLIGVFNQQWSNAKWEHEYARLETAGYFTAERQAELFDTRMVPTDREDMLALSLDRY
jgi:hypothetical protein